MKHYLEQDIQGMLKSFTVTRKYLHQYLVKSNSPILLRVVLACLDFSGSTIVLAYSSLLKLVMGCSIFYKKREGS